MISQLPWKVDYEPTERSPVAILDGSNKYLWLDKDNSEYIVKACNMFPELVEALSKAIDYMDDYIAASTRSYIDCQLSAGLSIPTLEEIKNILNKAKGEKTHE